MSQEALNKFAQKVNSDADLRNALEERFDDVSSIPSDDLISFAREQGYSFSVEEVKEELSDEELEGVSGGTTLDKSSPLLSTTGEDQFQLSYDLQDDSFSILKFY